VLLFSHVLIGDQERYLLLRKGRFETILEPGEHIVFGRSVEFEKHNVRQLVFESSWSDHIVKEHAHIAERFFVKVETGDAQVAVVYFDGKFARIVAPGKRVLFWRGPVEVTAEVVDAKAEPQVRAGLVAPLARLGAAAGVTSAAVDEGKAGLLYLDNRFVHTLAPGAYGFWNAAGNPQVEVVDLRWQTLEIPGQEILTRDKVSIRVNIWSELQIADPVKARQSVKDVKEYLYRMLQLAVRQTLGRRTLEEVLAEKVEIDESAAAEVREEMAAFGVHVGAIRLKDIILPGEMREILNQVVAAEKQAQANLIRRREETAATRSLLNTAKLMEDNPLLVRLKELESLEKVAEKVGKITINGGLDWLLQEFVTLRSK
jgi:regulator of protease activity HflC (stomatin/prohibitin superfamily)